MGKLPAIQFYIGDWLKDPNLSMCSPSARGIWIDILCAMHELGRAGQLRGTADQLARVARCSPAEFVQALDELSSSQTADVTLRNGVYTITNRRMKREHEERESVKERVKNYRKKPDVTNCNGNVTPVQSVENKQNTGKNRECNGNVTLPSSSSPSTSKKKPSQREGKKEVESAGKHRGREALPSLSQKPTLIPDDFQITPAMRDWSAEMGLTVDLFLETEKFKNHCKAAIGEDAFAANWEARWKNWILRGEAYLKKQKENQDGKKFRSKSDQWDDTVDEYAQLYAQYANDGQAAADSC